MSIDPQQTRRMPQTRSGACILAAVAVLAASVGIGGAQTLALDFAPPDMVVTPVCVARNSDADLIAHWGRWDQRVLPDRDVGLINRDMRRLAELDPLAWDPVIQRVITLLPAASDSFTPDHVILARIEQLIALGRLQDLKAQGLVQQLLDRGDENSPRMLNALAGYLNEGIGIDRDTTRGDELLMASGYGGNADALLRLSHLAVIGAAPEGWDINPHLAVTMAFGALVGQIDPLICDRIARIAREFSNGEVVSADHDLAVRWYRFAADLGDPIAAWRVAEYQLQSELVTKDNKVLLDYLTIAAEGNLPYAQVMLGRVHEAGALAPVDLAKAQTLYEAAAAQGDRAGLIRLSGFLEARLLRQPDLKPKFMETLDRLAALDDTPAWVFAKKATHVLTVQGRWAGQAAARALLEQGAAMDDPAAIVLLAQMDFGAARTDADFYMTIDNLVRAVSTLGEVAPTADLQAAFLCKAPNAPLFDEAAYWAKAEAAIGSSSTQFTKTALAEFSDNPDPLAMAALQTQALYGRATPIANLLAVLDRKGASASELAFWNAYADRYANVATARAALALTHAATPDARAVALDQFRVAHLAGDEGAALKLAKALLTDETPAARSEAASLLTPLAEAGDGEAMTLLPIADPATYAGQRAVFEIYAPQIEARGDFFALMLALPFLSDADSKRDYRARAITAMACTFEEAVAFAGVMRAEGNLDDARRWLTIATHIAGEDAWKLVSLGDSYQSVLGADGEAIALAFYEQANTLGSRTAVQRLLRVQGNPANAGYDPDRIIALYVKLVAQSDPDQVPAVLEALARKDVVLRRAVEAELDLDTLYANAARAGHPAAMREHANRLRLAATTRADIEDSTLWLINASKAGDVRAMGMLAQAYSMGVGVPVSLPNARSWFEKAAAAGDQTALGMVQLLSVDQETE